MRATLIWSTNSLEENYNNIVFIRTMLLKNNWLIQDDWVNSRIKIQGNIPHFLEVQGYDYLKVGIEAILNSDLVVFFFTKESSYLTTLLKYACYNSKKIIIIYKTKKVVNISDINTKGLAFLQVKSIAKFSDYIK